MWRSELDSANDIFSLPNSDCDPNNLSSMRSTIGDNPGRSEIEIFSVVDGRTPI